MCLPWKISSLFYREGPKALIYRDDGNDCAVHFVLSLAISFCFRYFQFASRSLALCHNSDDLCPVRQMRIFLGVY